MNYESIKKDDSLEQIEKKLKVFGYPSKAYRDFIFVVLLENLSFLPKRRKQIGTQIKKLQTLKQSILSRLYDIELEIFSIESKVQPNKIKKIISKSDINKIYNAESFFESIDARVNLLNGKDYSGLPIKRRPKTVDYIIGATLSYFVKDRRGARWHDIYELLRYFDNEIKVLVDPELNWLHHQSYTQLQLEEGAKKIKKNYPEYIKKKKELFILLSKKPLLKIRS